MSGETIKIGDDIEITVVAIRGDKVRLGITAPKAISVHRSEVYDTIKRENREAAEKVEPIRRPFDSGTERPAIVDVLAEDPEPWDGLS